jgi:hypothetical protein
MLSAQIVKQITIPTGAIASDLMRARPDGEAASVDADRREHLHRSSGGSTTGSAFERPREGQGETYGRSDRCAIAIKVSRQRPPAAAATASTISTRSSRMSAAIFQRSHFVPSRCCAAISRQNIQPISTQRYREVLPKLEAYWNAFDHYDSFLKFVKVYTRKLELAVLEQETQVQPCYAGQISGVLDARGEVRMCELRDAVGNVRDTGYDFGQLWFSPEADAQRASIKAKECHCTHSCFLSSSLVFNPRTWGLLYLHCREFLVCRLMVAGCRLPVAWTVSA